MATKNLSLSRIFVVAEFVASSEKVKALEVVAKNLSLRSFFPVAEWAAYSEKVEVE